MNIQITISPGSFISAYWITMRPYLLFVSGITGLSGLSFAESIPLHQVLILFAAFFLSYGFGQALTDCFQIDTDTRSSPYRPLVRKILRKRDVLLVSLTGLFLCGIALGYYNSLNFILAVFCIAGLATYTYFKKRWWGGPWYNAWIVALLFMMGYLSGGSDSFQPQVFTAMLIVFFGYMNFVLVGYFKDVSADAATGYHTLPVVFGRTHSAAVSNVISFLFFTSLAVTYLLSHWENMHFIAAIISPIGLCLTLGFIIHSQRRLHKNTEDSEAHKAVTPTVHSYILALMTVTVINKPAWLPAMVIFYLLFVYFMSVRTERSQI
jgi:4-hydroxybenzoate polyprenyltransferase